MARSNSKPRAPRTSEELHPEILGLDLTTAFDNAQVWWNTTHLLDDLDINQIDQDLNKIQVSAVALQIRTCDDAIQRSGHLLAHASEVDRISGSIKTADGHRVHRFRNHLCAVLTAVAQDAGSDPTLVIETMPDLSMRPGGDRRPMYDDEVLLMRHRSVHCLVKGGRHARSGVQYALSEAGALPVETTQIHLQDFDNPRSPSKARLPGARYHNKRTVDLPRWTHAPLATTFDRYLAQGPAALTSKVAYGGDSSSNPGAAASLMLRRTMMASGLGKDCPKPFGVPKWRAQRTVSTHGFAVAQALLGKDKPVQVHNFIGEVPDVASEAPDCDVESFYDY